MPDSTERNKPVPPAERRHAPHAMPQQAVALPPAPQRPASPTERMVWAVLTLMGVATFAGIGLLAISEQISSGRDRFTGREVTLTGSPATWFGLTVMAFALPFIGLFVQQLPQRMRKGAFVLVLAVLLAALVLAFRRGAA